MDPKDISLEAAAKRELWEEAGAIEVGDMTYVGSRKIDDWRYRSSLDAIHSTFFMTEHIFGAATAQDDIDSVAWSSFGHLMQNLVAEHKPLGEMLLPHLEKYPS